jgi:uncharacterized membrane protein
MAINHTLVAYLAMYHSGVDAETDYRTIKEWHARGVLRAYDAAVLRKDLSGDAHMNEYAQKKKYSEWTGLAVGALLGVIFPPSVFASAAANGISAVGAGTGAMVGHFWRGLSRSELNELGDLYDLGTVVLIVIANLNVTHVLPRQRHRAIAAIEKHIKVDAASFQAALGRAIVEANDYRSYVHERWTWPDTRRTASWRAT